MDQLVGVDQFEGPAPDGVHPDRGILLDGLVPQQLPRQQGYVIGGGEGLPVVKEAGAAGKMRVLQAQLFGPRVHALDEDLLRAAKLLGHGHGAVVGGDDGDALDHLTHAHLLACLEIDAAPAEGGCPRAGRYDVIRAEHARVHGLKEQQQGHDLGDAGGKAGVMGVLFIEDRPGLLLHQHGRWGRHRQERGGGLRKGPAGAEDQQHQDKTQHALHGIHLLHAGLLPAYV